MTSLDELKTKILDVIKDNHYSWDDVRDVLTPISIYTNNPTFKQHIDEVVKIMIKDRNGDSRFTIEDLTFLRKDVIAVTSLVTSILLIMSGIPQMKLEYKPEETEALIFKLLAYVFLVIIPKETGNDWTYEEKESVLDLSLLIYNLIKASHVAEQAFEKVQLWFQRNGWCKCLCGTHTKNEVVEEHLPEVESELALAMDNIHEKEELVHKIEELESEVRSIRGLPLPEDKGKDEDVVVIDGSN